MDALVEISSKLTALDIKAEVTNEHLKTLNGSVASHTDKISDVFRWTDRAMGGGIVAVALLLPTLGWLLLSVVTLQKNQVSQNQIKTIITDAIKNNIIIPVNSSVK